MRHVRLATAADIPELVALDTIARTDHKRAEAIAGWVAAGECRVLCEDGVPLGYAALTQGFLHSSYVEMLMVAEPTRRTGVGRALLEHCIALVPGAGKLWTSTNESNRPMQRLLAELGFVRSGVIENLDPGDPELIYLRIVPETPDGLRRT